MKSSFFGNLIILALLIISCFVWHRVYKVYTQPSEKELVVTFLDVGQGDSILITTPSNKNILIDGGTIPKDWSTFDAGRYVVVPHLKKKGIKILDIVIATHPDIDHIGGLISVLKNFKVDTFLDAGIVSATQTYEELLRMIEKNKINYRIADNDSIQIDPSIRMEVLSPVSGIPQGDANNNSIVIKLEYGKISFLFTADIAECAEKIYVREYGEKLKSTVLKVAHHGGNSSSSDIFLKSVQPQFAVISCGRNNPFGHPSEEVLERLKSIGTGIYRTDEKGHITVKTDGKEYRIFVQKTRR